MLKRFLAIALLTPLPALAQTIPSCDLSAEFGSFTSTIDARAYEAIMEKILAAPGVTEKHVENLGPNGERTLCVTLAGESAISSLYQTLKPLVPAKSKTGWVSLSTRLGDQYKTRQIASWLDEDLEIPATDRAFD